MSPRAPRVPAPCLPVFGLGLLGLALLGCPAGGEERTADPAYWIDGHEAAGLTVVDPEDDAQAGFSGAVLVHLDEGLADELIEAEAVSPEDLSGLCAAAQEREGWGRAEDGRAAWAARSPWAEAASEQGADPTQEGGEDTGGPEEDPELAAAAEASLGRLDAAEGRVSELALFCVLEPQLDSARSLGAAEELLAQVSRTKGARAALDRQAVARFQQATPAELRAYNTALFDQEVGVLSPAAAASSTQEAASVREAHLVVVDTHPTTRHLVRQKKSPHSEHGYTLGIMAMEMLCDAWKDGASGPCPVTVRSRLALPYRFVPDANSPGEGTVEQDLDRGGEFGTYHTLARAIRAETRSVLRALRMAAMAEEGLDTGRKKQSADVAQGDPLTILNLSLGWNPIHTVYDKRRAAGGTSGWWSSPASWSGIEEALRDYDELPVGSRMVMAALVEARCRGLLPVTAAGNRSSGGNQGGGVGDAWHEGPILPAAWMDTVETPGCSRFVSDPAQVRWDEEAPLVFAASGLGAGGQSFELGRPKGHAPLSAYGARAFPTAGSNGSLPAPGAETLPLMTGTSVSALVLSASAAAAHVGTGLPEAKASDAAKAAGKADPAHGLMWALHETGSTVNQFNTSTALEASFAEGAFGGAAATVREVDLCTAAALAPQTWTCDSPAPTAPTYAPTATELVTITYDDTASQTCGDGGTWYPPIAAEDTVAGVTRGADGVDFVRCPQVVYPSPDVVTGVWPQPPTHPCPPCSIDFLPSAEFKLFLAKSYWEDTAWLAEHGVVEWTQASLEIRYEDGAGGVISENRPLATGHFEDNKDNLLTIGGVPAGATPFSVQVHLVGRTGFGAFLNYSTNIQILP